MGYLQDMPVIPHQPSKVKPLVIKIEPCDDWGWFIDTSREQ